MCVLCMISPDLNPLTVDLALSQRVTEGADAAASVNTQYTMEVGDTFAGEISNAQDGDWVAITLTAGTSYEVSLTGVGSGELNDPYLYIYDSNGSQITRNDDGGPGLDSFLTFTASYTGTYYLGADAFGSSTGTYDMTIEESDGSTPSTGLTVGTFDELADFLMDQGTGTTYVWDTSASNVITVDIRGLTADGQQLAIWAMEAWEMVADIDFAVRGGGLNEFNGTEMITADDRYDGAYAYFPNSTDGLGVTGGVELNVSTQWLADYGTTLDSYSFQTYIHEFGHALGLNHLGDYNGFASYPNSATFENDSWQVSIMSYFSQDDNTTVDATYATLLGPMIADIIAIQDFYGAPDGGSVTSGDTTYGLNSNLGNYLDLAFTAFATDTATSSIGGDQVAFTIYDRGGRDTIDLSFLESDVAARITLASGTFSDIGDGIGSMGIAVGTVIENLYTGAADDYLAGNAANNVLRAGGGDDVVFGGGGSDRIFGQNDADELFGGRDNDFLYGGNGDDLMGGGSGNDVMEGGSGEDAMFGSSGNDRISGNGDDDLIGAGTGQDIVNGDFGNDEIYGGGGRDYVYGGDGDDLVGGGFGRDTIYGDSGDDTIWGQTGEDRMFGGTGNDIMAGGSGGDTMFGGSGDDDLSGGFGSDFLYGGAGSDTLNGNFGNDVLTGGLGQDTFVFDSNGNKTVTDLTLGQSDALVFDLEALGVQGGLTGQQIIDTYASVEAGTVVISINGMSVTLEGWSSTTNLGALVMDDDQFAF